MMYTQKAPLRNFWVEPFVHYKKYMVYKIMIYEEKYLMESMTIKKKVYFTYFFTNRK